VPPYEIPTDAWLHIEGLKENVEGGWITGHSPATNRIVIYTDNVTQFSMNVSALELDWSRRVWVRLDDHGFELTHKRNPVIHLQKTSTGGWELVDPDVH
jgi:hypothetical protein